MSSEKPLITDEEIDVAAHDALCHQVIRSSARRHGWELVQDHTPMHELLGREMANVEASNETRIRQEVISTFLEWLFGEGPHPAAVMKRLFAIAYKVRPQLIAYMTMADLGLLMGDKKQNHSYRIRVLLAGRVHSPGQKRVGARKKFSAAQQGNRSRRKGELRKQREAAERN